MSFLSSFTSWLYSFFARIIRRQLSTCYPPSCEVGASRMSVKKLVSSIVSWGSKIAALSELSTRLKFGLHMPCLDKGYDFGGEC